MSKQDELDKLKKLQEHNDKSREGMLKAYNKRNGEINALVAEIAEEAKPKLRHGEIRYWPNASDAYYGGLWSMVDLSDSGDINHVWLSGNKLRASRSLNNHPLTESVHVCYTIDDLTAMQEDVTDDLELNRYDDDNKNKQYIQLGLSSQNELFISTVKGIDGQVYHLKGEELAKVRQYIQQAEATLNRKKGSE